MITLVTGGAGFIGSHLVDLLVSRGEEVRVFDNLEAQVHGGEKPPWLNQSADFVRGEITDRQMLERALEGVDLVYHLASAVGVGQSQYEISRYYRVNVGGTAELLDILANGRHRVRRIVSAGSMTCYGEGMYHCPGCGPVKPPVRDEVKPVNGAWDPVCPSCAGNALKPLPTPEDTPMDIGSFYAQTKKAQEEMLLLFGQVYGLSVSVLRLFNVYGTRQSLSNPYTGVAAIFLSRLKNRSRPVVYEDGLQTRDFVAVADVCRALAIAGEEKSPAGIFNVGSGRPVTIISLARMLSRLLGVEEIEPEISFAGRHRDLRHCFADAGLAKLELGWEPSIPLEDGMAALAEWARREKAEDGFLKAEDELRSRGLV